MRATTISSAIVVAVLGIALSGCAERQRERLAQLDAERDQRCRSFGAQPGTEAYVNCRVQLEQVAASRDQAAAAQAANARAVQRDIQRTFTQNRPVTCSTYGTSTTCY